VRGFAAVTEITPPILWQWDGEALQPATGYWRKAADHYLAVGQRYRMVEEAERSEVSHKHEFAWLKEAWNSLPDELLDQYPNSEILRKHGLIAKGHCTMTQHVCASVAEAERLAAILKPYDAYAIVRQRGPVVTVYKAVSQSKKAMGAAMFQRSKTDLMEFVGDMLGVDPETIGKVEQAA
jgi:hypothetical protein